LRLGLSKEIPASQQSPRGAGMLRVMAPSKAVLLAAGRGTRLASLTADRPKPLLEVAGKPLLAHIVGGMIKSGLREFIVVAGHLAEQIEHWCTTFAIQNPGVTIQTIRQQHLNGTGAAMLAARPLLANEDRFVFGWGDILMDGANYPRFATTSQDADCDLLLAVNDIDDPWRGAAAYVDSEMRVRRLVEKPPRGTSSTRWNCAGLFSASRTIFDYLDRLAPSSRGELELPQAIAAMIAAGRMVRAFEVRGFWSDVGTFEDLAWARAHFDAGTVS
jgi:UDP-N-acetylglucosamine diphosphorylase / glucose-1-phosphate thymidylyltransferase / UDP-N-acetylgalactosamine diphosphorylase / glucosamine-1-phosphate N-acetyltransferase / galactosamine-1-phosphate N-acetyltransferase